MIIPPIKYEPDISFITEQVRSLSGSYGTAPYTVVKLPFDEALQTKLSTLTAADMAAYSLLIGIMVWEDYNAADWMDHLKLSIEYLALANHQQTGLLNEQAQRLAGSNTLQVWIANQACLALGIILASARRRGYDVFVVDDHLNQHVELMIPKMFNQKLFKIIALRIRM